MTFVIGVGVNLFDELFQEQLFGLENVAAPAFKQCVAGDWKNLLSLISDANTACRCTCILQAPCEDQVMV